MDVSYEHIPHTAKTEYEDGLQYLIDNNAEDFNPVADYYNEEFPGNIPPEFFGQLFPESSHCMSAAFHDGDLVGVQSFTSHSHRDDYPINPPFPRISVTIVDKPYRGYGIGTELNAQTLEFLRTYPTSPSRLKQDWDVLGEFKDRIESFDGEPSLVGRTTWEGNETQRSIYQQYGFSVVARKEATRVNGEDTLIYAKPLPTAEKLSR